MNRVTAETINFPRSYRGYTCYSFALTRARYADNGFLAVTAATLRPAGGGL
jgi:hypothetical protein